VNRSTLAKTITLSILAIVLLVLPVTFGSPRLLNILIMMGLGVMLAVSNRLVLLAGTWHFGQIAFYGIGAYALTLLTTKGGLPFWFCFLLAGVISGAIALGFAYGTLRVKGIYFAILTLALVEILRLAIMKTPSLGGYMAVFAPAPPPIFGIAFTNRVPYYYFMLVLLAIILVVLYLIEASRVGKTLNMIASSPDLAKSIGINAGRYRALVFCICCVCGGFAGAFVACYIKVVSPITFGTWASITIWFYMVIGGIGSFWGPIIGAILLISLPEWMPGGALLQEVCYAIACMLVIFFLPGGLVCAPALVARKLRLKDLAATVKHKLQKGVDNA
jgi:branched-chain amino acid transport system permease protein